jgi:hypothetical protein
LGLIKRTFISKGEKVIKTYTEHWFVNLQFEYCVQAWRPHLAKDIIILEKVQRRATRMIVECRGKTYDERLELLGLTTLETRRLRADRPMLEVFKILKGFERKKRRFFEVIQRRF